MTPREFNAHLKRAAERLNSFAMHDLPEIAGQEAKNHFRDSFDNEGFTDKTLQKWQPRKEKRRKDGSMSEKEKTRVGRKILTGETKNLSDIDYKVTPGRVVISSEVNYAKAHNEGTDHAGRGRSTTIPQRKFMGDSSVLNEKIVHIMKEELDKIFKL